MTDPIHTLRRCPTPEGGPLHYIKLDQATPECWMAIDAYGAHPGHWGDMLLQDEDVQHCRVVYTPDESWDPSGI